MSGGFTPGPWAPHPINRWVSPVADMEMPVCLLRHESYGIPVDEPEVRANAALIAAAPEMFATLEDIVNPLGKLQRDAKAKGNRLSGMAHSIANDLEFVQSMARAALALARGERSA